MPFTDVSEFALTSIGAIASKWVLAWNIGRDVSMEVLNEIVGLLVDLPNLRRKKDTIIMKASETQFAKGS